MSKYVPEKTPYLDTFHTVLQGSISTDMHKTLSNIYREAFFGKQLTVMRCRTLNKLRNSWATFLTLPNHQKPSCQKEILNRSLPHGWKVLSDYKKVKTMQGPYKCKIYQFIVNKLEKIFKVITVKVKSVLLLCFHYVYAEDVSSSDWTNPIERATW